MTKHVVLRAGNGLLSCAAYFGPIVMDALAALEERLGQLEADSVAIRDAADAEERDFSEEETEKIEANAVEIEKLKRQIAARKLISPTASQGRRTTPEPKDGEPGQRRVPAAARDSQRHGFNFVGEMLIAARQHALGNMESEGVKKLLAAATTYGNEGTGADGGFLVPPEFSRDLWQKVEAEENLMTRCAELTVQGNSMSIPKDETTPWGTAGIRVYWDGEAAQIPPSKPVFENSQFRLSKLTALAPVTDEALEDAMGYESFVKAKVPGLMAHAINNAIIDGTGVGMPLGALRAPSLVTVNPNVSQPAASLWFENISAMWSRMYAPWRRNAIWVINQDLEPALDQMAFDPAASSKVPVYLPAGGLSASPYATLKGRPVIPLQAAKTAGTVGDIMLIDFSQYWVLKKAGGMRTDTSIHLYFDQAVTAFRFIFRMNGQPAWSSAIAPQNSSNALSWAVALGTRS